jgi:hypothetical protein
MLSIYTKGGKFKECKIEYSVNDFFYCELGEREKNKKYFFIIDQEIKKK